ncbi:MAG: hypothetical protein KBS55_03160 [Bacteroidales bacterium]|nr:hypothetical protein [Candidatus Cryptobacteroides aphodequi]
MKAVFVSYNQAYNEQIVEIFESHGQRGFTQWKDISGRGTVSGEPHLGSHAWPVMNEAVLAVVPDEVVEPVVAALKGVDEESPELGLRAFVWNVETIL